jgi:RNB domain
MSTSKVTTIIIPGTTRTIFHLVLVVFLFVHLHMHCNNHDYHGYETTPPPSMKMKMMIRAVEAFSSTHHHHPSRRRTQSQIRQSSILESQSDDDNYKIYQPETQQQQQQQQQQQRSSCLESILRRNAEYQFTQRLIAIPIHRMRQKVFLAEVFVSKQCILAQILSVILPSTSEQQQQPPKFLIQIVSQLKNNDRANTTMVVDIGQITTIWDDVDCAILNENFKAWSDPDGDTVQQYVQSNADHIEFVLDRLHQTRRSRPNHSGNSKTTIQKLIKEIDQCCPEQPEQEHATMVFQKVFKTGMNYQRIIDSSILLSYLKFSHKTKVNDPTSVEHHRVIAAYILANDAQLGGRLKRWPCIYVSTSKDYGDNTSNDDSIATTISIINGGWFITDQAVRTGTEARKFVERAVGAFGEDYTIRNDDNTNRAQLPSTIKDKNRTPTIADERIFRRLECLAMGELINAVTPDTVHPTHQESMTPPAELEFDVREVLRTMKVPISPDGAKQALIQTGYWSKDISKQASLAKMIQPWSKPILDAAKWYTNRRSLDTNDDDTMDRIDLTELPCVCVDAMKATFRDDAIGVRLRSSTGRTVLPDASKWEILIHITDVSDIYSIFPQNNRGNNSNNNKEMSAAPSSDQQLCILRDAAARRGSSRYDLPFGPLHLFPPIVLQSLSFPATKGYSKNAASSRCVTIWAYIDERNGQLVDCGIERTLISSPTILTFGEASNLLDRKPTPTSSSNIESATQQAAQAILMVVERNLKLWDNYERQHNVAAQKREVRLAAREQSSLQKHSKTRQLRLEESDDGVNGFRRTRGHRLVDVSLNLYTNVAMQLLQRSKAPIPRAMGADYNTRGGRVGTAPLRRYIDGQIQRQLLAVFCHYGTPMTMEECQQVSIIANQANNSINNIRAIRNNIKRI